jgi:DNA-binding NtrC family response regulator
MVSTPLHGPAAKLPTVLVVEGEPLLRLLCSEALEDVGFTVVEGRNAEEALRIPRGREDIRIQFADVRLSIPNGVLLARWVRQHWPGVRVVLTSAGMRIDRADLPDQACFIPKPYCPDAVVSTIRFLAEQPSLRISVA